MVETLNRLKQVGKFLESNEFGGILFYSETHEPSKALMPVLEAFVNEFPKIRFATCDLNSISQSFAELGVASSPEFWVCRGGGLLKKLVGVDPRACYDALMLVGDPTLPTTAITTESALAVVKNSIKWNSHLAIAGVSQDPEFIKLLGFVTKNLNLTYVAQICIDVDGEELLDAIDANEDELPLIFIQQNNEKIPAEIVLQNQENINDKLRQANQTNRESVNEYLGQLVKKSDVMVFMKGKKSNPYCRFSRALVALLHEAKVDFNTFDILENEFVRDKLKTFSQWPTYPQVYVRGEFIGGLDIIREMVASSGGLAKFKEALLEA